MFGIVSFERKFLKYNCRDKKIFIQKNFFHFKNYHLFLKIFINPENLIFIIFCTQKPEWDILSEVISNVKHWKIKDSRMKMSLILRTSETFNYITSWKSFISNGFVQAIKWISTDKRQFSTRFEKRIPSLQNQETGSKFSPASHGEKHRKASDMSFKK